MRGALSDKFLLISMCIDDRYVKTYLVLSMAKKLGLFPHAIRYVRLRIRTRGRRGIEHGGLYLLMDEPKSALARSHNELAVVVRRRNDPARKTMSIKAIPMAALLVVAAGSSTPALADNCEKVKADIAAKMSDADMGMVARAFGADVEVRKSAYYRQMALLNLTFGSSAM